jgi:hypothetical protein
VLDIRSAAASVRTPKAGRPSLIGLLIFTRGAMAVKFELNSDLLLTNGSTGPVGLAREAGEMRAQGRGAGVRLLNTVRPHR